MNRRNTVHFSPHFIPTSSLAISPVSPPPMLAGSLKKRQRAGSSGRLSSVSDHLNETLENTSLLSFTTIVAPIPGGFNDSFTADVVLCLSLDPDVPPSPFSPLPVSETLSSSDPIVLDLHLHSSALCRANYFSALLSDRWNHHPDNENGVISHINLKVSALSRNPHRPFDSHVAVLRLLYTLDFPSVIVTVSDALDLLHVALEILFDDCVRACVRFLEAVPWTDEEEKLVLKVIPFLRQDESGDLLARIAIPTSEGYDDSSEEMLHGLILSAIHSHPTVASVKAFVAKILRDFSSRESVRRVLDRAFLGSLETVRDLLGEYTSPDFRVTGDNDETEAIQRLNLHAAVVNTRKLLWLVERMIELRVADNAVKEWSDQATLAADLQKAFRDETWRNIAPGLPVLVMKSTLRLASVVATGSVLASRLVRMKLVRDWLPVLNVCRDIVSSIPSGQKLLYQELEETFLLIISTLPMSDSRELLQRCLCFSTRNVEDCPHLISAFNTWFRRANQSQHKEGD